MTRYSELYRKEQAEKEQMQQELQRQINKLVDEVAQLRSFVLENHLQGQLAEWAVKRSAQTSG